jgi:hypothetical protein
VSKNPPLVIIGGGNLVAPYLMRRLAEKGLGANVISRRPVTVPEGFRFTQMDLLLARNWIAPEDAIIISLMPTPVLIQYLPRFIGVRAIVTLAIPTKASLRKELGITTNPEALHQALDAWCTRSNVHYTFLRPAMIYDGLHDRNISYVVRFVRRLHFYALAAPAKGLRQPLHADDAARAIIGALDNEAAYRKTLNIAGGEILTCRAMAERIFTSLGQKPHLLMLPTDILQACFHGLAEFGLVHETSFDDSVFRLVNKDQIRDVSEGLRLLAYTPRNFTPVAEAGDTF